MQCPTLCACCGAGASGLPPRRCTCPACSSGRTLGHHTAQALELHFALMHTVGLLVMPAQAPCAHTLTGPTCLPPLMAANGHHCAWSQRRLPLPAGMPLQVFCSWHSTTAWLGQRACGSSGPQVGQVGLQLLGRQLSAPGAAAGHSTLSWQGRRSGCWNGEGSSPAV